MQKYKTAKTLGDGAFGVVYKAQHTGTGETVAIKKMKEKYTSWNECIELREIKALRKLDHPNIMKLKEVLLVSDQLYMVFEYLEYNLYEVYAKMKEQKKSFTESEIKSMVYQILSGLAHMHKAGFFHRDLKPENILIYNNVVKLCDFGLAREIRSRPPFTDYVSTRWYRAPELLLRSTNYNSPVDIFAVGCIMAEFYTQTPLFPGANQVDQLNKMVKVLGTPDKTEWAQGYKLAQAKNFYFPNQAGVNLAELIPQASPEAIDLMYSMLHYSSRKRPIASELLKHEFFKGVKVPDLEAPKKQMLFQEQPKGAKLDTTKEDKKLEVFRTTKQKFKQTRKHDAEDNNPFKQFQAMRISKMLGGQKSKKEEDDLDQIIKQLQQKGRKQSIREERLPILPTKQKFYTQVPQNRKQIRMPHQNTEPLKNHPDLEWKFKSEEAGFRHKDSPKSKLLNLEKHNRASLEPSKFAYSFQPATLNNVFLPVVRSPIKSTSLAYASLSKQKSLITGPLYKF